MIEEIVCLLDRANVPQESRPVVCRVISRVIFGLASYRDDRKKFVDLKKRSNSKVNKESEPLIWEWVRGIMWDRKIATQYWRALGQLLHTRDVHAAAETHGLNSIDVMYLFDQLTVEDIDEFVKQNRNWRVPSIDDKTIREVLAICKPTINKCVWDLRFIWQYDSAKPKEEWNSWFASEAIKTIFMYEDRRSLNHLVHTVQLALKAKCKIMQKKYSTLKHGTLLSSDKVGGGDTFQFVTRNVDLIIDGEAGPAENPELAGRCVTTAPSIDTDLFIEQVERESKQLARYLRLVVLEEEDTEFEVWLDHNKVPTIDDDTDFAKIVAKFCNLKRTDLRELRRIAGVDYTIGQQLASWQAKLAERKRK
jgi:hypothetical protein